MPIAAGLRIRRLRGHGNSVELGATHRPRGNRMAEKLNAGDGFPSLTLNLVGGGTLALPDRLDSSYSVVLFYRGHW